MNVEIPEGSLYFVFLEKGKDMSLVSNMNKWHLKSMDCFVTEKIMELDEQERELKKKNGKEI